MVPLDSVQVMLSDVAAEHLEIEASATRVTVSERNILHQSHHIMRTRWQLLLEGMEEGSPERRCEDLEHRQDLIAHNGHVNRRR